MWIKKRKRTAVPVWLEKQDNEKRKNETEKQKTKKERHKKQKESKELREGSPTNNFLVGTYGLRRAESWEDMPSMSSEVGKIKVSLYEVVQQQHCSS